MCVHVFLDFFIGEFCPGFNGKQVPLRSRYNCTKRMNCDSNIGVEMSSDGAVVVLVVKILASHQCQVAWVRFPELSAYVEHILVPSPRFFSPGVLVFLPPQKPSFPNCNSTWKQWTNRRVSMELTVSRQTVNRQKRALFTVNHKKEVIYISCQKVSRSFKYH